MLEESYCTKHKVHFGSIKCPMCAAAEATQKAMADIAAQSIKSALEACRASDSERQFAAEEYGQFTVEEFESMDKISETAAEAGEGAYTSSALTWELITDKYNATVKEANEMFAKNIAMLDEMRHAVEIEEAFRGAQEFDPTGRDQHEAGAKLDGGKVLAGILGDFSLALLAVVEVGTYGAEIYSRGGWQSVPDGETRYLDAEWRHLLKRRHEAYDVDSGLLHDAHRAWNVLAALELKLRRMKGDLDVTATGETK